MPSGCGSIPAPRPLLATMRAHGAHSMLVSGGFGYFTRVVAERPVSTSSAATRWIDDGRTLTGEVERPILGRQAKLAALEEAPSRDLGFAQTLGGGRRRQ